MISAVQSALMKRGYYRDRLMASSALAAGARSGPSKLIKEVFRCLVWVIAKLTHVWDVQIELTGSMVGYSSEVDEVFKSPSHSFC